MATEIKKIISRRDTAAKWEANNPILAQGEIGVDTTNKVMKIGDGVTPWKSLTGVGGVEIVNDLTTGGADKALSAEMGKKLDGKVAQLGQEFGYVDFSIPRGGGYVYYPIKSGEKYTVFNDGETQFAVSIADKSGEILETFGAANIGSEVTITASFDAEMVRIGTSGGVGRIIWHGSFEYDKDCLFNLDYIDITNLKEGETSYLRGSNIIKRISLDGRKELIKANTNHLYRLGEEYYKYDGEKLVHTLNGTKKIIVDYVDELLPNSISNGQSYLNLTTNKVYVRNFESSIEVSPSPSTVLCNSQLYTLKDGIYERNVNYGYNNIEMSVGVYRYTDNSSVPVSKFNQGFICAKLKVNIGDKILYSGTGGNLSRLLIYKDLLGKDIFVEPAYATTKDYKELECTADGYVYYNHDKTSSVKPMLYCTSGIYEKTDSCYILGALNVSSGELLYKNDSALCIKKENIESIVVPDDYIIYRLYYWNNDGTYISGVGPGVETNRIVVSKDTKVSYSIKRKDGGVITDKDITQLNNDLICQDKGKFVNMSITVDGVVSPSRIRILTPPLYGNVYLKPRDGYKIKNIVKYDSLGRVIGGQNVSANKYVEVLSDDGFCRISLAKANEDSIISTDEDAFEVYYNFSSKREADISTLEEKWIKCTNFGLTPTNLYKCNLTDYTFGKKTTTTQEIYEKFNDLVGDYIVRDNIGQSSDGQDMYMYRTNPIEYQVSGYAYKKKLPTILIVCGQHGFEKSSIYGMYYLLKDLNENYSSNEVLRYIRQYVRLIIVPCANPYGIDNFVYKNANAVNLNRNWDSYNWESDKDMNVDSDNYGGITPFDQPETSAIKNIIENNPNIVLIMDCHTNGGGKVTKNNINWLNLPDINIDVYSSKIMNVCQFHLSNVSLWLNTEYQQYIGGSTIEPCGYISSSAIHAGTLASYTAMINTYGVTFEVFNGFPNDDGGYDNDLVKKACSELIGNFINVFCGVIPPRFKMM